MGPTHRRFDKWDYLVFINITKYKTVLKQENINSRIIFFLS